MIDRFFSAGGPHPAPAWIDACDEVQARFGELWLKGHNRDRFVAMVVRNVRHGLRRAGVTGVTVSVAHGRLRLKPQKPSDLSILAHILADTPGLTWVQPVVRVPHDTAAVQAAALRLAAATWTTPGPFAVKARRSAKNAPLRSEALAAAVGSALAVATGRSVDLSAPAWRMYVDVSRDDVTLWAHQVPAPRGLPVGTAGTALLLLSGGFDSPVAGYQMQNRGCRLDAVHFHSPPFVSPASRDKVLDLARVLAARQGPLAVHVVPFTAIQVGIRDAAPERLRVVLYRRFMYRIADALAASRGAEALCAGESLGQVASQTLSHLSAVDAVTTRTTLRPLLGCDKQTIIDAAHQVGTYDISVRPADDACALFVPASPATRTPLSLIEAVEQHLPVAAWVEAALEGLERTVVGSEAEA